MGKKVFANGMEIAHKAGGNKVLAAFPDVCMSPPSPPAGPVPLPYPDTSMAGDLKEGSKGVKIGGQPAALHGQSYYKSSPLGDEAATRTFGASVVTHQITGKTYFQASSMDVVFEGKKVNRHLDITTSNHGSQPGATPPMPGLESMSTGGGGGDDEEPKCPCCKGPLHDNQKDPDTGKPYERCSESEWYGGATKQHDTKVAEMHAFLAKKPGWAALPGNQFKIDETLRKQKEAHDAMNRLKEARTKSPPCENLHDPPDEGCGVHFKKTNSKPNTSDSGERARLGFTDGVRNECIRSYKAQGRSCTQGSEVCHKTPLAAGGCPSGPGNLVPKDVLSPECAAVDDAQTSLQGLAAQVLQGGK
jgi:uncharacterized Zn-binding protein involved in type VI secretion